MVVVALSGVALRWCGVCKQPAGQAGQGSADALRFRVAFTQPAQCKATHPVSTTGRTARMASTSCGLAASAAGKANSSGH